jgi:hypothetical protein
VQKSRHYTVGAVGAVLLVCSVVASNAQVFALDPVALNATREGYRTGSAQFKPAFKKLKNEAQTLLELAPVSVTQKQLAPPGGDKHDYMSMAPYWWPDPKKQDGLPYIRRDGEVNPDIKNVPDHTKLTTMAEAVQKLALAYFISGNEEYADKASSLIRVWFLEPATKMNPNLKYGQGIKGITEGRGAGLIEGRWLSVIVDAIGLLGGSKSWTEKDEQEMKEWFLGYLRWLQESPLANDEAKADNNHGVWFDVQFTSIALFVGRNDLAQSVLEKAKSRRIAIQIEPDGRMPAELARTKGLGYTTFNIEAFMGLATIAHNVGIDLWNYQTPDGRSIRKAIDWARPYMVGEAKWEYKQISEYETDRAYFIFKRAARVYNDQLFASASKKLDSAKVRSHIGQLLYGE